MNLIVIELCLDWGVECLVAVQTWAGWAREKTEGRPRDWGWGGVERGRQPEGEWGSGLATVGIASACNSTQAEVEANGGGEFGYAGPTQDPTSG